MKKKFLSGLQPTHHPTRKNHRHPPTTQKLFFEGFLPDEPRTFTWVVVIRKKIYSNKSKFQKIEIFDTKEFNRILAIDDQIQLSTKDEFIYHEMLVHPALLYHPNPKKILIIGGGDGGCLREVVKHPVKEIFLTDIDEKVIEVSKKYLPSVSKGNFKDKRLKIFNKDGQKFIRKYKDFFDVIINDLTDPKGPSEDLWKIGFFKDIFLALRENGIFASQTGYLNESFGKITRKKIKKVFPYFKVHKAFVACFPFDEHTFSFASKKIDFNKFSFTKIKEKYQKLNLETKYYCPEIHFASGILPKYLKC